MKALSFIRQRSFARYVMIDLLDAAGRHGWSTQWIDVEGRLLPLHAADGSARAEGVARLAHELREAAPHVLFSYGIEALGPAFSRLVSSDRSSVAQLVNRPTVYFFFDFGDPFDRPIDGRTAVPVRTLQRPGSLVFCWERDAVDVLGQYGIRHAQHFPMAVNERMFGQASIDDEHRPTPLVFAGGPTHERIVALSAVADLGLTVHSYETDAWGPDPALRAGLRPALLHRRELADAYRRSRIAVNVTRPHGPSSLNMRAYETMASGCLLLTDDRADARELFDDCEHLCLYRTPAELRSLAERYLTDEPARRRIAAAGRERVLAEHTYAHRFARVRDRIERFVRQAGVFARLDEFERVEPAKGLAFADYADREGLVTLHREHLSLARARCHEALGDRAEARRLVRGVLADSPACLDAVALARVLGAADLVAEPLRHLEL